MSNSAVTKCTSEKLRVPDLAAVTLMHCIDPSNTTIRRVAALPPRIHGMHYRPSLRHATLLIKQPLSPKRSLWTSNISSPVQSYISKTDNPRLNLSIEHYLLQHSPPDSHILFLYTNSPCVVIGRNQNPWLETNLRALQSRSNHDRPELIRRRSGGGAVYHDHGNTNWTVISPPATFTRDKHAEMVVRALRAPPNNIRNARVNERHDIVLDQVGHQWSSDEWRTFFKSVDPADMHRTPWTARAGPMRPPLKCSGSAYKLTRTRALHHGTCLLNCANLQDIWRYLRSDARHLITAKGVASVPSPVANTGVPTDDFVQAVQEQFEQLYGASEPVEVTQEDALDIPELRSGYDELGTATWTFSQTPRFEFRSHPIHPEGQSEPAGEPMVVPLQSVAPPGVRLWISARHGQIEDCKFSLNADQHSHETHGGTSNLASFLKGQRLFGDSDWATLLSERELDVGPAELRALTQWLERVLPLGKV